MFSVLSYISTAPVVVYHQHQHIFAAHLRTLSTQYRDISTQYRDISPSYIYNTAGPIRLPYKGAAAAPENSSII